ncbi:MAG: UDP-3-O-(3-hydroxymyristoyl)glucosamine N-acyltransferase [Acidobacteriota bacterium]|nr:UDP-3-O-(3-hydroxymyristoyl)glucosamine N-acyltransferase [Acidobacteriota bacterium]
MKHKLAEIAKAAGARLVGDGTREVGGIASIDSATPDDLTFVEDERRLEEALASTAGAIIAGEFAANAKTTKPLLVAQQPRLAFIRAVRLIRPLRGQAYPGVHSTAVVHDSAKLGKHISVGPHAVIGEQARIGDGTRIGPGCSIGARVKIGADCYLDANVTVYAGTEMGDRVTVLAGAVLGSDGFGYVRDPESGRYEKFPQVGKLEIGDDVEIGANSTLDRGALDSTVIARGVKIDNLVHVGHNARIGENVVIAAQTGISGSSVIEKDAVVGGQVGIGDHARIEEGVILGSGSGVLSKKIVRGKGVVFWGRPARPLQEYLKQLAAAGRESKKEKGKGKK